MNQNNPDKHAEDREKKQFKEKHGMQVTNRSIKTVIQPLLGREKKKKK